MKKKTLVSALFLIQFITAAQTRPADVRKIIDASANVKGEIVWTAVGETTSAVYVIEQFRWNKWIKIGEVMALGSAGRQLYNFRSIPFNGENICRVKLSDSTKTGMDVKFTAVMPVVKFSKNKKRKKIEFFDENSLPSETMFEIFNEKGQIVKKGWGKDFSYENLPKGKYTLYYDNTSAEFKKVNQFSLNA